jgi:predicted DNA binding CopG/RHH family protein
VTYTTNMRLDDDLAEAVKAYAAARGISVASAIRVLLYEALNGSEKP